MIGGAIILILFHSDEWCLLQKVVFIMVVGTYFEAFMDIVFCQCNDVHCKKQQQQLVFIVTGIVCCV